MPFAFTLDIKEHYGLDEKKDCHFSEGIVIQVELLSKTRIYLMWFTVVMLSALNMLILELKCFLITDEILFVCSPSNCNYTISFRYFNSLAFITILSMYLERYINSYIAKNISATSVMEKTTR